MYLENSQRLDTITNQDFNPVIEEKSQVTPIKTRITYKSKQETWQKSNGNDIPQFLGSIGYNKVGDCWVKKAAQKRFDEKSVDLEYVMKPNGDSLHWNGYLRIPETENNKQLWESATSTYSDMTLDAFVRLPKALMIRELLDSFYLTQKKIIKKDLSFF